MKTSITPSINWSMFLLVVILFLSNHAICQVTQNCTYGDSLNNKNHFLDSATATQWIQHYTNYIDSVQKRLITFDIKILQTSSESFSKKYIQEILELTGCIGERVFMGINDKQKIVAILGGVDSCGVTLYITENFNNTLTTPEQHSKHASILKTGDGKGLVEFGQNP